MPKGIPNKRYTPEYKKLVIETMLAEKQMSTHLPLATSAASIGKGYPFRKNPRFDAMNRARLCGQHKKAPGAGILSSRRRGVAQAGPLQSLAGCAHDCKSRYSGQSFRLLQRK